MADLKIAADHSIAVKALPRTYSSVNYHEDNKKIEALKSSLTSFGASLGVNSDYALFPVMHRGDGAVTDTRGKPVSLGSLMEAKPGQTFYVVGYVKSSQAKIGDSSPALTSFRVRFTSKGEGENVALVPTAIDISTRGKTENGARSWTSPGVRYYTLRTGASHASGANAFAATSELASERAKGKLRPGLEAGKLSFAATLPDGRAVVITPRPSTAEGEYHLSCVTIDGPERVRTENTLKLQPGNLGTFSDIAASASGNEREIEVAQTAHGAAGKLALKFQYNESSRSYTAGIDTAKYKAGEKQAAATPIY